MTSDKPSVRQDEYTNKSFQDMVFYSKEHVDNCVRILDSKLAGTGAVIRPTDDLEAYFHNGKRIRLADIEIIINGESLHGECKDFASLIYYPCTGLPVSYIEKLMDVYKHPERLLFLFKENEKFVEEYSRKKGISKQKVYEFLINRKRLKVDNEGHREFIPYGNFLDVLEANRHAHAEERVPCSFEAHHGEKQHIWKLDCMLPISDLTEKIKLVK